MKKNNFKKVFALGLSTALVSMSCLNASAMDYKKVLNKKNISIAAFGSAAILGSYFLYNHFKAPGAEKPQNRSDLDAFDNALVGKKGTKKRKKVEKPVEKSSKDEASGSSNEKEKSKAEEKSKQVEKKDGKHGEGKIDGSEPDSNKSANVGKPQNEEIKGKDTRKRRPVEKSDKDKASESSNEEGEKKTGEVSKQVEKKDGKHGESKIDGLKSDSSKSANVGKPQNEGKDTRKRRPVEKSDKDKASESSNEKGKSKAEESDGKSNKDQTDRPKSNDNTITDKEALKAIQNREVNGTTNPIMFEGVKPITEDEKSKIVDAKSYSKKGKKIAVQMTELDEWNKDADTILILSDGKTRVNEMDLRENPGEYFRQDKESGMCYIKLGDELYEAGKFTMPTLGKISEEAQSKDRKGGKMFVAYANPRTSGLKLLDIQKILDSKKFDLANPASNQNCIETISPEDSSPDKGEKVKLLSEYWGDNTQGPAFMLKCPWTSLCLLHMPGLNGMVYDKETDGYSEQKVDKINLLKPYGIETSSGYGMTPAINANFGEDTSEDNDKSTCMIIKNANLPFDGGSIFTCEPYTCSDEFKQIDIVLDAALPHAYSGSENYTEEQCKLHIKRHYLTLFESCRAEGTKRALLSFIGAGVFGNRIEWHKEVLDDPEVKEAMENSGTTYIFNAYNRSDIAETFKEQAIDISDESDMSVFDRIFNGTKTK